MKTGLIALNGCVQDAEKLRAQLLKYAGNLNFEHVIGVDGGCGVLELIEVTPTVILGDFDSVGNLERFKRKWPVAQVKTFQVEKDFTDAELAFEEMDQHHMDRVFVIGATGGRLDHQMSILFLLKHHHRYCILDEQNYIETIQTPYFKKISRSEVKSHYVSLLPLEEGLMGVNLKGFKYPLNDAHVKFSQTVGISNEVEAVEGEVSIQSGAGFLMISRD